MGHKVNPYILRIGIIRTWQSKWFAKSKDFPRLIKEDYRIRNFIKAGFRQAAISKVVIERLTERMKIYIYAARPGIIIGRHGADIERLVQDLNNIIKGMSVGRDDLKIIEVKDPALDAQLIGENIAFQIEKRTLYRRAIKRAIEQAMMAGAKGVKITCSGRLGGAEIARTETYKQGKIPLSTFRADIDYALSESLTTYGLIGIKVWVYKGDILIKRNTVTAPAQVPEQDKEQPLQQAQVINKAD
ncbi:MAG: 30S ribosomal protein S3 [Candidatus Omnitrophica bacterium]|nr:30S ribosomal protein S3 [Candidatus Omnitrophota bacterium]